MMNYCDWCGGKTNNEEVYSSEISLLDMFEEIIDKIGREEIYYEYCYDEGLDLNIEETKVKTYWDSLNNINFRTICDRCLKNEDIMNEKFYSISKDGDEFLKNQSLPD